MSIASELTKLETDITNAYDAVQIKGGTIPSNKNTENLSTAISSISGGGGKPEQSKTATPSTSSQTILPDEGYTLSSVTVNAVTSSIDSDIQANNIKQGVNILGVQGNVEELNGEEITVKSTSQEQIILPSENKNAFTKITVQPIINEYEWAGNSSNFSNITITPSFQKFTYKENHPSRMFLAFNYANIADDIFCKFKNKPETYTVNLASQAFRQTTAKRIGFDVSLSSAKTMVLMFYSCSNLEEIYGEPFDTSGIVNSSSMPSFQSCSNLKKITFVNSCINFNIAFEHSPLLEDNTLISIANGLNSTAIGQTFKLNTTPKVRCSSIMGIVNGQGIFEESSSGTMSLEEFITIEKGWTLS